MNNVLEGMPQEARAPQCLNAISHVFVPLDYACIFLPRSPLFLKASDANVKLSLQLHVVKKKLLLYSVLYLFGNLYLMSSILLLLYFLSYFL